MLRKRSRPVTGTTTTTSKQLTLPSSDHNSPPPPPPPPLPENISSKLTTQPFCDTTFEISNNTKPVMSPSSVLETKPFFSTSLSTTTPLWLDTRRIFPNSLFTTTQRITPSSSNKQTHSWAQPRIGIALIDDDNNTTTDNNNEPKQRTNLVVFGSNLRVQIPSHPSTPPPSQPTSYSSHLLPNSPNSPVEFGIKTPRSNFGSLGRNGVPMVEKNGRTDTTDEGKVKGSILMEEMEQSEDYTCVISHGPIPKTTHIFGNCIVESCCGASSRNGGARNYCHSSIASQREKEMRGGFDLKEKFNYEVEPVGTGGDFLSFCHHCKKRIGHGTDIFMYRGEKAFCSQECRGEGMLFDGVEF